MSAMNLSPQYSSYGEICANFDELVRAADAEREPAWSRMMLNHLLFEMLILAGRNDEALPELTTPNFEYQLYDTGTFIQGRDIVADWLALRKVAGVNLCFSTGLRVAVDDWGIATEQVDHRYVGTSECKKLSLERNEPEGTSYLRRTALSTVRKFNASGFLTSLRVYPANTSTVIAIPSEKLLEPNRLARHLERVIDDVRRKAANLSVALNN